MSFNEKMKTKVANSALSDLSIYTECITIVCFDCKFFLFDVNYMFIALCASATMMSISHSVIIQSIKTAHWPMGIKMLRPINGHLVRERNCDIMRN